MTSSKQGWVGIDLDGTLAYYDGWKGIDHIGDPIPVMRQYVLDLKDAGVEVRIFTARVDNGQEAIEHIEQWCLKHLGQILPVTNKKDMSMVFCVDDRAVSVEANTGYFFVIPPSLNTIKNHWSKTNGDAPNE